MFKRYWTDKFRNEKYADLVNVLSNYEFDETDEGWEKLPGNKELSDKAKVDRTRINKMLVELYSELKEHFYDHPIKIRKKIHILNIYRPFEERKMKTKKGEYIPDDEAISIMMELPFTPRIGERIELDFLDKNSYQRGYVHDVKHAISGDTQTISLYIHPYNNYYYKWEQMKKEYEQHPRCLKNW